MQLVTTHYFEARACAGLSHRQAATGLGITVAELGSIEAGDLEPDALLIARMATLYGTSSDWLIGLSDDQPHHRSM